MIPAMGNENFTRGSDRSSRFVLPGLAGICLLLVVVGLAILFKRGKGERGVPETTEPEVKVVERVVEKVVEVEKIVEVEKKEPLPSRYVDRRTIDTVKLWNGLEVRSVVETEEGGHATAERGRDDSFQLGLELKLTIPRANRSIDELSKLSPELPGMLPDLDRMLKSARISPFYHALYEAKTRRVQQNLTRLDRILSRHNFYDCETVLELTHPDTGQRALLIQSEMDVVSDGSDGDRWPKLDNYISMSDNYRYSTSYAWPKKSSAPNPMLARSEKELKAKRERFACPD